MNQNKGIKLFRESLEEFLEKVIRSKDKDCPEEVVEMATACFTAGFLSMHKASLVLARTYTTDREGCQKDMEAMVINAVKVGAEAMDIKFDDIKMDVKAMVSKQLGVDPKEVKLEMEYGTELGTEVVEQNPVDAAKAKLDEVLKKLGGDHTNN